MKPLLRKKKPDTPPRRRRVEQTERREAPEELFRRNRTITGSASSRIVSADGSNNNLASDRVRAHQLVARRRKVMSTLGFMLLLAVFVGVLVSQYTGGVVVTSAATTITKPLQSKTYEAIIDEYMRIYPLERFRFAMNMERLVVYAREKHPEVKAIEQAGMDRFGVSRFAVEVREPVASWTIDDQRYYTDAAGVSFRDNYFAEPAVKVVDNSGADVRPGNAIVSSRLLTFIGQIVALSKESRITVEEVRLPPDTTRQVELKLAGRNTIVRMTVDRSAGEQVEDMARTLQYMNRHGRQVSQIDVRVEGKAFYR